MNRLLTLNYTLGLIIALLAVNVSADELIDSCNECHGEAGISTKPDVPIIAGISPFAFEISMVAYTDGSRIAREMEGNDMKKEVEKLSPKQLQQVIDHYSALPFIAAKQTVDSGLAAAGKKLHEDKCERCHTENGSLADDDSSILAGQWKAYLLAELTAYSKGERTGSKKMMAAMEGLTEQDLQALAEFYAGQK
jgi:cytochrome subunit of sulfide dehydrogenase